MALPFSLLSAFRNHHLEELDKPKSRSLTESGSGRSSTITLSGFISRCRIPCSCVYCIGPLIWSAILRAYCSWKLTLSSQQSRQSLSLQQFANGIRIPMSIKSHAIYCHYVRMRSLARQSNSRVKPGHCFRCADFSASKNFKATSRSALVCRAQKPFPFLRHLIPQ